MIIGFTGTQQGMNSLQKELFANVIIALNPVEFHHGDCIGADAEAHDIVREFCPNCKIVIHPPFNSYKRAYKTGNEIRDKQDYMVRNQNIVDECQKLIAVPKTVVEEIRSGTWSTVRKARKQDKEVIIIHPK